MHKGCPETCKQPSFQTEGSEPPQTEPGSKKKKKRKGKKRTQEL
jgi:hypothetical protein